MYIAVKIIAWSRIFYKWLPDLIWGPPLLLLYGRSPFKKPYEDIPECNIEHDYYRHLAKSGKGLVRNAFFKIEAMRFQAYQKVARYANLIIAVSTTDADYLRKQSPNQRIEFVPCFHENNRITAEPGKSDYILYHGKLSVIENERAVLFLTKHVFSQLKHTCIIAGMNPTRLIREAAAPTHI